MSDDEDDEPRQHRHSKPSPALSRRGTVSVCLPRTSASASQPPAEARRRSTVAAMLLPRQHRNRPGVSWLASFLDLDLRDDDGSARMVGLAARAA